MYSPTTRVLTVLELLQAHGRLSGAELARRLEVDGRTLRRYIAKLEDLGIPVVAERGRYGCYSLVAGFKLPPMMFTDDEALALALGLLAARGLGLAEAAPAVQSAQAKLERVMPAPLRPIPISWQLPSASSVTWAATPITAKCCGVCRRWSASRKRCDWFMANPSGRRRWPRACAASALAT